MLMPTAISADSTLPLESTLLPIASATPNVASAEGGDAAAAGGLPLEGGAFAAMLSTLLSPDGGAGRMVGEQSPLAMNPAAVAALSVVPAEGVEPDTETGAPENAAVETGESAAGDETDDERAASEIPLAATWMFLPPPPPSPPSTGKDAPEAKVSVESAMPRSSAQAAAPAALADTDATPVAAGLPAPATPAEAAAMDARGTPGGPSDGEAKTETPASTAGSSVIAVAPPSTYRRIGDGLTRTTGAGTRVARADTSEPSAPAQFAGNALPADGRTGVVASGEAEKTTQVTSVKELVGTRTNLGIESAEAPPHMPAETSATPLMPAGLPPVAAPVAVEANHASSALQAVEKVLDAVETTAQAGGSSVQLRLELGDAGPLTVQVSLREGQVHAVFRSDSAEMRELLAAAWSQQAPGRDAPGAHAMADPDFRPLREVTPVSATTGEGSLHSHADAHSGGRQQASAQSALEFAPPARSRVTASPLSARNERTDTPRVPVPSVHLSAFA